MSTDLKRKPQTQPATRISLRMLGVLIIILVVGCRASQNQEAALAPPADFEPIAEEVDLSARSHDGETLGQFTLAETADVGVFFSVQEIDTPYFDLSLFGPDDESWVILHSEDYRTDAEVAACGNEVCRRERTSLCSRQTRAQVSYLSTGVIAE